MSIKAMQLVNIESIEIVVEALDDQEVAWKPQNYFISLHLRIV